MASRSTTTTVRVEPMKSADGQALGGGDGGHRGATKDGVSQRLVLHVPPHRVAGEQAGLEGVLPRTGLGIAVFLAIVALVLIALGTAITRAARTRTRLTRADRT
jgi:hypothetical protein